jgi:hypothetical protein
MHYRSPPTFLIPHSIRDMLRQCVYALVQGWEDLNNHSQRCHDIAYQTAVGREHDLASAPTLCRLQKLGSRAVAVKLHAVLVTRLRQVWPGVSIVFRASSADDSGFCRQKILNWCELV